MANYGGLQLASPLVDDEVAVGLGGLDLTEGQMTYVGVAGIPVVDRRTGNLRSFLYTEGPDTSLVPTYLLGLDGDTVTLAVAFPAGLQRTTRRPLVLADRSAGPSVQYAGRNAERHTPLAAANGAHRAPWAERELRQFGVSSDPHALTADAVSARAIRALEAGCGTPPHRVPLMLHGSGPSLLSGFREVLLCPRYRPQSRSGAAV